MRWFVFFSTLSVVYGYMNIVLVGPIKEIYPLARHYSNFYNIPFIENPIHMYPQHFIMISREMKTIENTHTIDIKDYPHKQKNPNYFISWVKQIF